MDLVTHTSAPCAPTGAPPSRATLRWVAECLGQGAEVRMVRPLAGGGLVVGGLRRYVIAIGVGTGWRGAVAPEKERRGREQDRNSGEAEAQHNTTVAGAAIAGVHDTR